MTSETANAAETLFKKAEEYFHKSQWLKALAAYQKILQRPEVSPLGLEEAFVRAGECHLNLQIFGEAEDYFRQAAAINPYNPEPHYYLGVLFTKTSRWVEAVFELKLALQLHPQEPAILRALGWAFFLTGRGNAGEKLLRRCLKINQKDLFASCDLAVLYLNSAAFAKAEKVIADAEKIAPRHPLLLNVKAACSHFKRLKNSLEKQAKPEVWQPRLAGEEFSSMPEVGPLEAPRAI